MKKTWIKVDSDLFCAVDEHGRASGHIRRKTSEGYSHPYAAFQTSVQRDEKTGCIIAGGAAELNHAVFFRKLKNAKLFVEGKL